MIFLILINRIAVCIRLYKVGEEDGNCLLFPTGKRIGSVTNPYLRHIIRSFLAGDGVVIIVDYGDSCYTARIYTLNPTAVSIKLTVKNRVSERLAYQVRILLIVSLGVPAEGSIGSNNYVTVAEFLSLKSLHGRRLSSVIALLGPHSLCSGNNLNEGIVKVYYSRVKNLSASTFVVIQNELGLLDTGSDVPFFLGNNVVVVTSAVSVIVTAGCSCCKHAHRKSAYKQNRNEQGCKDSGNHTFFHNISPFM